ncbi:hypothetical protein ABZP36_007665 [Zizania latifolia]
MQPPHPLTTEQPRLSSLECAASPSTLPLRGGDEDQELRWEGIQAQGQADLFVVLATDGVWNKIPLDPK